MSGELLVRWALGLIAVGVAWVLLDRTFKKIISNMHKIQERLDRLEWKLNDLPIEVTQRMPAPSYTTVLSAMAAAPSETAPAGSASSSPVHRAVVAGADTPLPPPAAAVRFTSRTESLAACRRRHDYLFDQQRLLPTTGHDGETVLVYGCGDGAEIVALVEDSRPQRVVVVDESAHRLAHAIERLRLHGSQPVDFVLLTEGSTLLPLADASVDYVHCADHLHEQVVLDELLAALARVTRPDGRVGLRIHSKGKLWRTLAASLRLPTPGSDSGARIVGSDPATVQRAAGEAGFSARHVGTDVALLEMVLFDRRLELLLTGRLTESARTALTDMVADPHGRPMSGERPAGLFDVYELRRR